MFGIVTVDPLEPARIAVELMKRGVVAIQMIEIANPVLQSLMHWIAQQLPRQAAIVRPFTGLAKLAAHEKHLLARLRVHIAVERAQVGKLLPTIAGHLA